MTLTYGNNTQPSSNDIYNHHQTETLCKFSIFVSKSRPRSIYVLSMWTIFHIHYDYKTCFMPNSLEYALLLDNMHEEMKTNNFQITKVQPQGVV